jgi:Asp-tRNA(Asn)/Glu-tRNA(Gln) amidotransferase A subunit family amidase
MTSTIASNSPTKFPRRFPRKLLTTTAIAIVAVLASGVSQAERQVAPGAKFHLEEATIAQIQAAILGKQITTEQLVRAYLARIKAYNGTCVKQPKGVLGPIETIPNAGQINAISTLNLRPASRKALGFDDRKARSMTDKVDSDPKMPDALEIAAAQDREFAKTGKLVGPLQGVVMSFKDQYDTFDMRSTSGADAFYANDRPPEDATFVQRLRAAGAIILAKANLAEYASGLPRSSFGGVFCNPYDTTRTPNTSSAGSGSSVAANFVTCSIGEETGSSVRGPAEANNSVGLSPTQELVSRKGMIQMGVNTRVGPICRTVEDTARVLDAYAGYDPKDPLTVFSIGRKPSQPYRAFANAPATLTGMRIGVVREYMSKKLFTLADAETIDIVSRAVDDVRKLGATVVDPGPEGALFTDCLRKYVPALDNKLFTRKYPDLFPVDKDGKPVGDHVAKLVDMTMDPSLVPDSVNLRTLGQAQAIGEGRYELNVYLRQRGDANIKSNTDLVNKANYYEDPNFVSQKAARENADKPMELNTADRMQRRFAVQQMILQCMEEQQLDALMYPTNSVPPTKIGSPGVPAVNGRNSNTVWTFLGGQGFPAITVPAGFTTQVYDYVRDPSAPVPAAPPDGAGGGNQPREGVRLVGPTAARLPVGVDFLARPFAEPTLLQIASAYAAATKHRMPPPGFGPVKGAP